MTGTNKIMEMTDTISVLKAKCSTSQSSLDLENRAFGILKWKYKTLKELMSQSESNVAKEIRVKINCQLLRTATTMILC